MRIFTPCWGDKNIDLLDKALGRSLRWPKNSVSIKNCEWFITTASKEEAQRIGEILGKISPSCKADVAIVEELNRHGVDSGMILIQTLREAVGMCLQDKRPMLMATPDFIYGDGTLETFKLVANEPGSCAAIAHLRVVPHMLGGLTDTPSNSELMSLAWKHAHISWRGAGNDPGNTYHGGVKWTDLGSGMKAVRHWMPSPFYYNFFPKDIEHFKEWHEGKPPGFGLIDHVWPQRLIEDNRLRFIGSSEAAMMVEVTDAHANVPPWNKPEDPAGFFRNHHHNQIQSQFISIFKGESE